MTSHIKLDHKDLYHETLKSRNFLLDKKRKKTNLEAEFGFHCQDIVFGELVCNECQYTSFQRSAMVKHVAKKHAQEKASNNSVVNGVSSSRAQNAQDLSNIAEESQPEEIGTNFENLATFFRKITFFLILFQIINHILRPCSTH